jgi:uncharacterized membrane protein YqgA involved in biofilm formation
MDSGTLLATSTVGGLILVGVGLRLLELRAVRVANFLPALLLAPPLLALAALVRGALGG